jgi:hypothetical protein
MSADDGAKFEGKQNPYSEHPIVAQRRLIDYAEWRGRALSIGCGQFTVLPFEYVFFVE